MPLPTRKIRSLIQYTAILSGLSLVLYTVNSFQAGHFSESQGGDVKALQSNENLPHAEATIPKVQDKHVGIENIQKDFQERNERLKDWHNWTQIQTEAQRVGPGEQGKPVVISPEEEKLHADLFQSNGFSGYASDKVAIDRSIPDIRHKDCKKKLYHSDLLTVSVVIPFFNEHWSTLLRTFHSVINRSPPELLQEVILVDDASTKDNLGSKLEEYISGLGKVRLVRLKERAGLITARLAGAKEAKAEVIIFLDSHTEANVNWLPPLLDPISQDYRTAVCPFIDVVDYNNMEYRAQDEGARGAFDWQLYYKRLPLLPEDLKHPTEPFKSPVMAGGLFAISSKFFWELGGYDPGLEIWGGEQYELSFKIWQCGGTMVDAPCSRVGHIYRKYSPFGGAGRGDYLGRNYKRVAAVWMDEYAEYVYQKRPHYRDLDPGDISEQIALRERLACKPFKWFMKHVAFDLPKHYPPVEPPDFVSGEIRSSVEKDYCVDSRFRGGNERVGLEPCTKDQSNGIRGEQNFALTWRKDVRVKTRQSLCWDVSNYGPRAPVLLYECHGQGGNQLWRYDEKQKWLVQGGNARCLDMDPDTRELFVNKCDKTAATQQWNIERVNWAQLAKWDDPTKDLVP